MQPLRDLLTQLSDIRHRIRIKAVVVMNIYRTTVLAQTAEMADRIEHIERFGMDHDARASTWQVQIAIIVLTGFIDPSLRRIERSNLFPLCFNQRQPFLLQPDQISGLVEYT